MAGMLHNLENNEAILLMYLAGELLAEDQAEVEHMLERDPAMRAELECLRMAEAAVANGLKQLDEAQGQTSTDESSIRRLMREMRRKQLELTIRPMVIVDSTSRRSVPGWVYPLATAAAAIFILLGLWGIGVIELPGPNQPQHVQIQRGQDDMSAARALFLADSDGMPTEEDSSIAQERESQAEQAADGKMSDTAEDQAPLLLMSRESL